jgi:hypothetical protein
MHLFIALANPNTTSEGRRRAKAELHAMVCLYEPPYRVQVSSLRVQGRGREAHVGLLTRIRVALGIRKTPRSERRHESERRRY